MFPCLLSIRKCRMHLARCSEYTHLDVFLYTLGYIHTYLNVTLAIDSINGAKFKIMNCHMSWHCCSQPWLTLVNTLESLPDISERPIANSQPSFQMQSYNYKKMKTLMYVVIVFGIIHHVPVDCMGTYQLEIVNTNFQQ